MRYGEDCCVDLHTDEGYIEVYADSGIGLVAIQNLIRDFVSRVDVADLYGILELIGVEPREEDAFWVISKVTIDDYINKWLIRRNMDDSVKYDYVAKITNFEKIEP